MGRVVSLAWLGLMVAGCGSAPSGTMSSADVSAGPSAIVHRFTDPAHDIEVGGGEVPDLVAVSVGPVGDDLMFDLEFAESFGDAGAITSIVVADPDTVPPHGPPPDAQAPYCSVYEGPYVLVVRDGAARVWRWDWATDEQHEGESIPAVRDGRHLRLTVPGPTLRDIIALASGQRRLSFSIAVSGDSAEGQGTDYFPAGTHSSLSCQTVDLG